MTMTRYLQSMMTALINIRNKIAVYLFPQWAHELMRRRWNIKWRDFRSTQEDDTPCWKRTTVPKVIREAVESGWFQPGSKVLDIGCGDGSIAAWLAEQGFEVMGVDYSKAAIERAKSLHRELPGRLEYKMLDICREAVAPARFKVLIDCGCFHCIPEPSTSNYARNVANGCAQGTRFVLLVATNTLRFQPFLYPVRAPKLDNLTRQVEAAFQPMFEILRMEKTYFSEDVPGLAFWLIRR